MADEKTLLNLVHPAAPLAFDVCGLAQMPAAPIYESGIDATHVAQSK